MINKGAFEVNPVDGTPSDLSSMSDQDVLSLWVAAMRELRRRNILRSDNTPTGDYAEWLVSKALGLMLEDNSKSGFDAKGPDGTRYQIKARRLVTSQTSKQLSALRNLDGDPFDELVVVLFDAGFQVQECWQVPIEVVREHAVYRAHVNGHILHDRGAVLADERVKRLAQVEEHYRLNA